MPVDMTQPIAHNPADPDVRDLLREVQGNILKSHGRDHALYLFFRFKPNISPEQIRESLSPVAQRVMSTDVQLIQSAQFKLTGQRGSTHVNLMFTASGYLRLGFSEAEIVTRFAGHTHFLSGMRKVADVLGDVEAWEEPYDSGFDMLLLVADDGDPDPITGEATNATTRLQTAAADLEQAVTSIATLAHTERGDVLRDAEGRTVEHFGYADGRSDPRFLLTDLAEEAPAPRVWDPVEPLNLVLHAEDESARTFGSFYVFRKLEQNVRGMSAAVVALADTLKVSPDLAGAMVVGRFKDGTPIVKSDRPSGSIDIDNDFRFDNQNQSKCPFHAHIRKVNPRYDLTVQGQPGQERIRRVARRGMPYGEQASAGRDGTTLLPTGGVGLLFACFQANIDEQFVVMQRDWANAPDFVQGDVGHDPLIGKVSGDQQWPMGWGAAGTQRETFGGFVTPKGGDYFFAPSLDFLRRLAP